MEQDQHNNKLEADISELKEAIRLWKRMRLEMKFMDKKLDILVRQVGFDLTTQWPEPGSSPQSPHIIKSDDDMAAKKGTMA